MPNVSVIIVCMNRPDWLNPCLEGLYAYTRAAELDVWVVAYCFSEENLARLRADWPSVKVIESREVRGFAENNNLALRQIESEYCFIVNDDTLQSMPVVDRLLADFATLPENAAAVQPKIVFGDGRVQTCGRAPWTAWRYMKHYLHLVDETKPGPWTMQEGLFRTWTLNGACFLIKTAAFREMGWFDERYFFTPEDIALGQQLNAAGYTVWADGDVVITHLAGATAGPMEAAIKPARVKGALLFYGGGKWLKTKVLSLFIWSVEAVRYTKHGGHCDSARNILSSVFDRASAKDTFKRFRP